MYIAHDYNLHHILRLIPILTLLYLLSFLDRSVFHTYTLCYIPRLILFIERISETQSQCISIFSCRDAV